MELYKGEDLKRVPFPLSLEELILAVQEEWDAIDQMNFMHLVEKLHAIMEDCIA